MQKSVLPTELFAVEILALSKNLLGCSIVINAAGDNHAASRNLNLLLGPNAALPVVIRRASEAAKVIRFIHVSSSAVQGDRKILDNTPELSPFSPYSRAKALAETWLLSEAQSLTQVIIYRPPGVHGSGRIMTEKIQALAASPISSVAGGGTGPTPQALLENVGDAVAFLATTDEKPEQIVHHAWEGLSSADFLRYLGGREPRHLTRWVARMIVGTTKIAERPIPALAPHRRRIELLWFGQGVAASWLELQGWKPPFGAERWQQLGKTDLNQ